MLVKFSKVGVFFLHKKDVNWISLLPKTIEYKSQRLSCFYCLKDLNLNSLMADFEARLKLKDSQFNV